MRLCSCSQLSNNCGGPILIRNPPFTFTKMGAIFALNYYEHVGSPIQTGSPKRSKSMLKKIGTRAWNMGGKDKTLSRWEEIKETSSSSSHVSCVRISSVNSNIWSPNWIFQRCVHFKIFISTFDHLYRAGLILCEVEETLWTSGQWVAARPAPRTVYQYCP